MRRFLVVLLSIVATALRADDIRLADGTVYHNATITSSDAASVTIAYDSGIARVMIPNLPPELRGRFKYDAKSARELLMREKAAVEVTNARVDSGVLTTADKEQAALLESLLQKVDANGGNGGPAATAARELFRSMGCVRLQGEVLSVLPDGILLDCPDEFHARSGEAVFLSRATLRQVSYNAAPERAIGTFKVKLPSSFTIADGDAVNWIARPTGEMFRYESVIGAPKTLRVYELLASK